MTMWRVTSLVMLALLALMGCTTEYQEVGHYRIATVKEGFAGFGCQQRTEFYFINRSSPQSAPTYLGTCGAPRFVTKHLHMPGDPSCFAVSEDGTSLVYFHRPKWCGAGEKARKKPGGVHLHSVKEGDLLLYRDQEQVNQLWSSKAIGRQSIRVHWIDTVPSRNGATCPQNLVINADGSEQPEESPGPPDVRCKGWQSTPGSRGQ